MGAVINDFGEYIPGSRKELYKTRGIGIGDLVDIPLTEYKELIRRDIIWPEDDYVKLVESGIFTPEATYILRTVRRFLPASAKFEGLSSEQVVKREAWRYIQFILEAKRYLQRIVNLDVAKDALEQYYSRVRNQLNMVEDAFADWDTADLTESDRAVLLRLPINVTYTMMDNIHRLSMYLKSYATESEIMGFPYNFDNAWKGVSIRLRQGGYFVVMNDGEILNKENPCETFEEAVELGKSARKNGWTPQSKMKKESSVVKVVRPQLEYIERIGPNLRNGHNVTPEHMLKNFGIRGGQFGNWNSQGDRQACLNYAFDALVDLSMALQMPLQFIGLPEGTPVYGDGRKLGVAFGARGIPGASAHYEPGNHVINLTKLRGAGSLAHEMGHAVDKWIRTVALTGYKLSGEAGVTGDAYYASVAVYRELKYSRTVDGPVAQAMFDVVKAMVRSELPISRQRALIDCAVNGSYILRRKVEDVVSKTILQNKGRPNPAKPSEQDKIGMAIKLAAGNETDLSELDDNNRAIVEEFAKRIKRGSNHAQEVILAGVRLYNYNPRESSAEINKLGTAEHRGELVFGLKAILDLKAYLMELLGASENIVELNGLLKEIVEKDDVPGTYKAVFKQAIDWCNDFVEEYSGEMKTALEAALDELSKFSGTTDQEAEHWGSVECIERKQFNPWARSYGESNYFQDAKKLDENRRQRYYSKLQEMFARAFESFVEDVLDCLDVRSQYLVHSTKRSYKSLYNVEVFPCGNERALLFSKFRALFDAIKQTGVTQGTVFEYDQLYDFENVPNYISYKQNVTVRKPGQKEAGNPSRIKTISESAMESALSTARQAEVSVKVDAGEAFDKVDTQLKEVQAQVDKIFNSIGAKKQIKSDKDIKKFTDTLAKGAGKNGIICGFGDTGTYGYSLSPLKMPNGAMGFRVTVSKGIGYQPINVVNLIGGIAHAIVLMNVGNMEVEVANARRLVCDLICLAYKLPSRSGMPPINLEYALEKGFIGSKQEIYMAGKILDMPQIKGILLNVDWNK